MGEGKEVKKREREKGVGRENDARVRKVRREKEAEDKGGGE